MRRLGFLSLLCALALLMLTLPTSATLPPSSLSSFSSPSSSLNLLFNSDFESSSTELEGWQGSSSPNPDARTGRVSAQLGTRNSSTALAQKIALDPAASKGRCFAIQFWAKASPDYSLPYINELTAAVTYGAGKQSLSLTNNTGSSVQLPVRGAGPDSELTKGWVLFYFYQCPPSNSSSALGSSSNAMTLELRGTGFLIDDASVSLQRCPDADEFDAYLRGLLLEYNLPSLAVASVSEGVTICAAAVGTKLIHENLPVSLTDRYHIGSDGKAMTAIIVGMAVEAGKLNWTTRISEVFPELLPTMTEEFKLINMTQLLSHSSGMGPDLDAAVFSVLVPQLNVGEVERNLEPTRAQVLKFVAQQNLSTFPGASWSYSNVGYVVAGYMAEHVLGDTYERLISTRVYDGLHLPTAGLGCQSTLGRLDAAIAHLKHNDVNGTIEPFFAGPRCDNPAAMSPAGIVHMSVLDFAYWAGWSAGEGKRGPHIVTPATIIKTHTGVIEAKPASAPPGTPPAGLYAMGWGYRKMDWTAYPLLFHGGSNGKNLAHVWADPRKDFAMVAMTNVAGIGAQDALVKAAERMYIELAPAKDV